MFFNCNSPVATLIIIKIISSKIYANGSQQETDELLISGISLYHKSLGVLFMSKGTGAQDWLKNRSHRGDTAVAVPHCWDETGVEPQGKAF